MSQSSMDGYRKACLEKPLKLQRAENAPGLSSLSYRVVNHADVLQGMLDKIATEQLLHPQTGELLRPLAQLTSREKSDPTVALMDAWAASLDVLSFYQERIANEGYLRTATERLSMLELARSIGYELNPGVAASTHLAFSVEAADDPYRHIEVPKSTQVMSVPSQAGQLAQIFETSEPLEARAEWNAIAAETERQQHLVIFSDSSAQGAATAADAPHPRQGGLYWVDIEGHLDTQQMIAEGNLLASEVIEISESNAKSFYPVSANLDLDAKLEQLKQDRDINPDIDLSLTAIEADQLYIVGSGRRFEAGQRLLIVGVQPEANSDKVVCAPMQVLSASADEALDLVTLDVQQILQSSKPRRRKKLRYRPPKLRIGVATAAPIAFNRTSVESQLVRSHWTGANLSAFLRIQRWPRIKLMKMIRQQPSLPPKGVSQATPGVYLFQQTMGFFGSGAGRHESLVRDSEDEAGVKKNAAYPKSWEPGGAARSIWRDSQGRELQGAHAYLEREAAQVLPNSWALLEAPGANNLVLRIASIDHQSRADFALSGKTSALQFRQANGDIFTPPEDTTFNFRTASAHLVSEALSLSGVPLSEIVEQGETELTLDSLYLDLEQDRAVTLSGERADVSGLIESETLRLRLVTHEAGKTRLHFSSALQYSYRRASLTVNANVVEATHGERVEQVLGSGDATKIHQAFVLNKPPLTFVAADNETGASASLSIQVDGVQWQLLPSLYSASADQAAYMLRIDDDGTTRVVFGDGIHGRRLPSGSQNVVAIYRSGMGADGEVGEDSLSQLKTRLLGLRSVNNAAPATGAAQASTLEQARSLAPQSVRTLGRIIAFSDYQDFATGFAGVGKAQASLLWRQGEPLVHLTVAPVSEGFFPASAPLLNKLRQSLERYRDPLYPLSISAHQSRFFSLKAKVAVATNYQIDRVEQDIRERLLESFGYQARELGQPLLSSEVIALIQSVAGVVYVDLDALQLVDQPSEQPATSLAAVLNCRTAYIENTAAEQVVGSQLLTILSAGIELFMERANG